MGTSSGKELSNDDLDFLVEHTRFKESTVREWFKRFRRDCPNGKLTPETFIMMHKRLYSKGSNARKFVGPVFKTFDIDRSGYIDFKEFMLAMDMMTNGTPEEKLMWVFRMYDDDGNGSIDLGEMTKIIQTLYDLLPKVISDKIQQTALQRSMAIFANVDNDGNGELDQDEFLQGCLADKGLAQLLIDQTRDAQNVFSLLI